MTKIKGDLKETNEFKPNVSLFDQKEDTSLFGSIKLNGYPKTNSFKCSQILKDERQMSEFLKLCEFSPNDKWTLLYRGTRDGFGARDFHTKCDGHPNTLTIIRAKGTSYIFGGFTSVRWESPAKAQWKSDPNAFMFSLTNKDNKSLKMKIDPNGSAILCFSSFGPTFGSFFCSDIYVANNANTTMDSFSILGWSYKHPQYAFGTNEAQTFLAGSHYFQLDEIEVYQKE
jgi:hypothetical protein